MAHSTRTLRQRLGDDLLPYRAVLIAPEGCSMSGRFEGALVVELTGHDACRLEPPGTSAAPRAPSRLLVRRHTPSTGSER